MSKNIRFRGQNIKIQIWDSAGQEKYKGLSIILLIIEVFPVFASPTNITLCLVTLIELSTESSWDSCSTFARSIFTPAPSVWQYR